MTGAECLLQQRPDKAEFHFPRTRYRDTVKAKRMLLRRAIHKISTEFVDLQPDAFQFSPSIAPWFVALYILRNMSCVRISSTRFSAKIQSRVTAPSNFPES